MSDHRITKVNGNDVDLPVTPLDPRRMVAHFRPEHSNHGGAEARQGEPHFAFDCGCGEVLYILMPEIVAAIETDPAVREAIRKPRTQ